MVGGVRVVCETLTNSGGNVISFTYKMAGKQCRSGVLGSVGSAPLDGLADGSGVFLQECLCVDQGHEVCDVCW